MEGEPSARNGARRTLSVAALVALVAFLPFVRGALLGRSFYFRDLSLHFFPLRRFVVEGLRRFELQFWNPYVHEGIPVSLPPLSYPVDLFQVFFGTEAGLSFLLALHVPLAAVALFCLARHLGLSRVAAAGGGIVYSLGGFALSTLNLYVYLQAVAWAPFVILAFRRAAVGNRRDLGVAAILLAVALSTTGVEVVLQTLVAGLVLAIALRSPPPWLRLGAVIAMGCGLAAMPLFLMSGLVAGSAREAGFATEVVLAHSIHPFTLLQTVIGGLYGDLGNFANRFWGMNFFPRGFPYFLSLYFGPTVLALAVVGITQAGPNRRLLGLLGLAGAVIALGRWAGLEPLVEAIPALHKVRYPSKAFFTCHLALALLAAHGLDDLARRPGPSAWRWLLGFAGALGAALAAAPFVPGAWPSAAASFVNGFFPPDYPWPLRLERLRYVLEDAQRGGLVAVAAGLLGVAVLARRLRPGAAAAAVAALVAADLLRTGAGLNPMVDATFWRLSPETSAVAASIRAEGGRLFTFDPAYSPRYLQARAARGEDHEAWSFALLLETLTPNFNVAEQVPSALSMDLTMLVASDRILPPAEAGVESFPALIPRLERAGVAHLLSLEPIDHPDAEPRAILRPQRLEPLPLYAYRLRDHLPPRFVARDVRPAAAVVPWDLDFAREGGVFVDGIAEPATGAIGHIEVARETPGRIDLIAEANRATVVVVRDAFAPGWKATVDDRPAPVWRADARHRAVPIDAGRHRVVLAYHPPGFWPGILTSLASALLVSFLLAGAWHHPRDANPASPDRDETDHERNQRHP